MTDPLDDPRVKALVEAANGVVNEYYNQVHGPVIYNIKHLDAALEALEGNELDEPLHRHTWNPPTNFGSKEE